MHHDYQNYICKNYFDFPNSKSQKYVETINAKSYEFYLRGAYKWNKRQTKEDSEIDECIWMPIQKYIDSPEISDFNRAIVQLATTMNGWDYTKKERDDGRKYEFFSPKFLEK